MELETQTGVLARMDIRHLLEVAEADMVEGNQARCRAIRNSLTQALKFHNPPPIQAQSAKKAIKRLTDRIRLSASAE